MRNFYEGKAVRRAIFLILGVSLAGVVGGFFMYFKSLDALAVENMRERVQVALNVEASVQQEILEEYSFWDEAFEKCIKSVDWDWISLNTGDYIFSQQGMEFSLAVKPDGSFSYVDAAAKDKITEYSRLLGPRLEGLIAKSSQSSLLTKVVSGYISIQDDVYLVSVAPFISEVTKQVRTPRSYLVFGRKLSHEYIHAVGEKYKLNGLDFSRNAGEIGHDLPVINQDNLVVGHLVWTRVYPSRGIMPVLVAIVCVFYLISCGSCWVILRKEAGSIKEQEEQLYFMATKDYLTGVSNRRHIMELGQQMLATHRRCSHSLAVFVLDIDYFKSINDRFGHEVGDLALSSFASICSSVLRSSDLFGRFGGEEFLVVLHDTEMLEALEVAERMRRAVEDQTSEVEEIPPLTVSIGVAVDSDGDDFEEIIRNADVALLEAKSKGRNRVEAYFSGKLSQ